MRGYFGVPYHPGVPVHPGAHQQILAAWEKLQRELAWAERRADPVAAATRRRHDRALSKWVRDHNLHRGRD